MKIPFLDLARRSRRDRSEIEEAIARVIGRGWFVLGPELEAFEREFALYCGVPFAVGTGNGTDALSLAIESCGAVVPGSGDEVITSALSAAFTALAICHGGAVPRFADVHPRTLQINSDDVERLIGPRTRAILPVHLYGNACDLEAIGRIARKHNLALNSSIVDCYGGPLRATSH